MHMHHFLSSQTSSGRCLCCPCVEYHHCVKINDSVVNDYTRKLDTSTLNIVITDFPLIALDIEVVIACVVQGSQLRVAAVDQGWNLTFQRLDDH